MLGRLYLRGKVIPADPVAAEKYLLMSAPLEPRSNYFLGKLYAGGQLGQIQPEKALEHYLIAARAGDVQSDIDLARLFSDGQGVKINKVYAYSFANLAKQGGLPYGQVLIDRLAPTMNSAEIAKALELSQGEMRARGQEQVSTTLKTNSTQGML
jgi:alginate biosynthesis protein AlgK